MLLAATLLPPSPRSGRRLKPASELGFRRLLPDLLTRASGVRVPQGPPVRGVFHISGGTPTTTRPVRRRREEQGLHILADAAEGVLPRGQSPDERQELMARHF